MTITLNISPEVEERLKQNAQEEGVDLTEYLVRVVEDAAASETPAQRIRRIAREIGRPLPVIDLSRESIYAE